jgi:two-component system, chemotaxis family, protein-glutamate methylesterase/glutaminase
MRKIRVLVVDDAVVFRRLVADELARDAELEVVGTAANGRIALAKLAQLHPDAIILDIEMPEMDGLTTLAELRKINRRLPVIMFSSLTERGAATTLDALALGATDYFTKPTSAGSLEASLEIIRQQLIPKIKAVCAGALATPPGSPAVSPRRPSVPAPSPPRNSPTREIQVLALGASTGGPTALLELLGQLPAHFPVPIVLVQHMPPMSTRLLAERLTARSAIRVQEGTSGAVLQAGQAWLAPGDFHMIVARDARQARVLVHQDAPENSCRPALDVLLRSVAKSYGPHSLTVVLTGMGSDGLRGCEMLREAGGQILVQDEATSVVWGMPGYVAKAGLADKIMPLALLGEEIVRRVETSRMVNGR